MDRILEPLYCDNCGIEVSCKPYISGRWVYCCKDCAQGFHCSCEARLELDEERRTPEPQIPY